MPDTVIEVVSGSPGPAPAPRDLRFSDALTVEAWIESDGYRAEAMQCVASRWRISERFERFDAYDASNTDGLATRGFFGAVFDGRYVYFAPQHDGTGRHGKALRYDTHGGFKDPASWCAYDAGVTSGLNTKGYYGGIFDGRYVFYIPRVDSTPANHTRFLRCDTAGEFKSPESWRAYDIGHRVSNQSGAFDGRYIYFCPGYDEDGKRRSGKMIRYDAWNGFSDPQSYCVFEAAEAFGPEYACYDGAVFDGRYVYYAPLEHKGKCLRLDTRGGFTDRASWQTFDASEVMGLKMGMCVGATFDGQHVYYVPYASSVVARFDTSGDFADRAAWSACDISGAHLVGRPSAAGEERRGHSPGLQPPQQKLSGYDGAIFDGRYVYLIPFWEGGDVKSGFHGKVLRYDTGGDFRDLDSWQAVDAGRTDGLNTVGFNAGAFDGRYIYMAPWRAGTSEGGGIIAHGNVLRYDTTGEDATFSLRAVDFGHNGGLCAAVPGPAFLVNTDRGVLNVRANRNLGPGRHYLAGVYDGKTIRLYMDGLPVAERTGRGRIQNCDAEFVVGRLEKGLGRFSGKILSVRLSALARSAECIAEQYAAATEELNTKTPRH